ncbi:MAG: RidA family protein [Pseudolabrys sp.]|nr:RidA family protein [Pseudolabrys sp.]
MTIQRIQPPGLFQRSLKGIVLYSHVVIGSGRPQVYISGQLARNQQGEIVGKGDMRAQIVQVGKNLKTALEAAGLGLEHLVKTTTFVTDIDEFFRHPDARRDAFGPALPASTTIGVNRLAHPDFLVEVEAIAEMRE